MPHEDWFPTPIYYYDIPETEAERINKTINALEEPSRREYDPRSSLISTRLSSIDDVVDTYKLKDLNKMIREHSMMYADICGYNETPYINASWFTIASANEMESAHSDGWALAGIYCYHNSGTEGKIIFDSSTPEHRFPGSQKYNSTCIWELKPGRILLYPGWLKYTLSPPGDNNIRKCINFTMLLR